MPKYYVVAYGARTGIFLTADEFQAAMHGHYAHGKSFKDKAQAEAWYLENLGVPQSPPKSWVDGMPPPPKPMQPKPQSFYAVRYGKLPGIFTRVKDFNRSTHGFVDAQGKKFKELAAAQAYIRENTSPEYAAAVLSMGLDPWPELWAKTRAKLPPASVVPVPLAPLPPKKKAPKPPPTKKKKKKPPARTVTDGTMEDLERLLKKEYAFTLSLAEPLVIYADASYEQRGEIGVAGLAASVYRADGQRAFELTSAVADMGMSSQQAEALAIISPLLHIESAAGIEIYSDCQSLSTMLEAGKPAKGQVFALLFHLIKLRGAKLHWVKGHADNASNNRVDQLARLARHQLIETKQAAAARREALRRDQNFFTRLRRSWRFLWKILRPH